MLKKSKYQRMKILSKTTTSKTLHKRNLHNTRYDFPKLISSSQNLASYVKENQYGDLSIDFSSNDAVLELNIALLKHFYQIDWIIPKKYLCPPIPGRVDYIHYIADLLANSNSEIIPKGNSIKALDIGVGANCIYPIIGNKVYGWNFVGSDIDQTAMDAAQNIINDNDSIREYVSCRLQNNSSNILSGIIEENDKFDFVVCNPPFHKSKKEAQLGTNRKIRNLKKQNTKRRIAMTVNHFSNIPKILQGTNLITTIPLPIIFNSVAQGKLVISDPPIEISPGPISMTWHNRLDQDQAMLWLRDKIQQVIKEDLQNHLFSYEEYRKTKR